MLLAARTHARPVRAERLGCIGADALDSHAYARTSGMFTVEPGRGSVAAEIPFIVETWARESVAPAALVHVNRTPITAEIEVLR